MGQISGYLRRVQGGYGHWCPGCGEMHVIPDSWNFEGTIESPTFSPSVKITGKKTVKDAQGNWTGEWVRDANGNALDDCCHYFLRSRVLEFCGDCTHDLVGKKIPLPPLPEHLRDPGYDQTLTGPLSE